MQYGSRAFSGAEALSTNCAFCQQISISNYILKETPTFRILADHAPLVEGHMLIVPRQHYACYGAVPATLDAELIALKREIQRFFLQFYAPIVFWEHGVFRQTVFHGHLHCFPFGELSQAQYELCEEFKAAIVHSQDDIRAWYAAHGTYYYLEASRGAFLFAPQMDLYVRIIQEVLWPCASARSPNGWRSSVQRLEEGGPLIAALAARWQFFQRQEGLQ